MRDIDRGIITCRRVSRDFGSRSYVALFESYLSIWKRTAETKVSGAAGERTASRGLGIDGTRRGFRCVGDAHDGREAEWRLAHQRLEEFENSPAPRSMFA